MAFTPFDFNEAISQRREHADDGLRHGSPVVGFSCAEGAVLFTIRRSQRKVYEIYDRLAFSAIGNQSDIEDIRLGAIDLAHREGYMRSPDDVTAHRLVGFSLSPALKTIFRDQFRAPAVVKAIFAELGSTSGADAFYILNYDGEFSRSTGWAALGGSPDAEDVMISELKAASPGDPLKTLLPVAARAWAAGAVAARSAERDEDAAASSRDGGELLRTLADELARGEAEACILDRADGRDARFRMLTAEELADVSALPDTSAIGAGDAEAAPR